MSVSIRKFEERDISNKIKWINDSDNNKYLHYELPLEYNKTLNWFLKNKDNKNRFDAVIEYDNKPVGLIGLLSVDSNQKNAEYYIAMGENKYKGKGIAKSASKKLLNYGFNILDLKEIYLYTETENLIAQKLFESIGFRKERKLMADIKNGDKFVDRYYYTIRKEEYTLKRDIDKKYCESGIISQLKDTLNDNKFFIKRDDLIPFSFGGNKARKAKYFFQDLEKEKANCVVTYGSSSSNHCRIVSNIAASKNIPCYIISPTENSKITMNSRLLDIFGVIVINCRIKDVKATINKTLENLRAEGYKPYFIQGGGHGNLGTEAYVDAYREIIEFEKKHDISFDYIFHASGTGSTQAGLICGKLMNNDNNKRIVGISIARKNPYGSIVIFDSVNSYMENIEKDCIKKDEIIFIDDYILESYGDYNKEILEIIKEIMKQEGIPLDTTYTGKAFWGMKEYIIKEKIKGKNILFIHTGGTPLFFDDLGELTNE